MVLLVTLKTVSRIFLKCNYGTDGGHCRSKLLYSQEQNKYLRGCNNFDDTTVGRGRNRRCAENGG